MASAGYVIPFSSIFMAVPRTMAVTPVMATIVILLRSRLSCGVTFWLMASATGLATVVSPVTPIRNVRGYPAKFASRSNKFTPSTASNFMRASSRSNGNMASPAGRAAQVWLTKSLGSTTVTGSCGLDGPSSRVNPRRVEASVNNVMGVLAPKALRAFGSPCQ